VGCGESSSIYSVESDGVAAEAARMAITLTQPHNDLTFMTPLSQKRADKLVRFVAEDLDGTVLDIGCGWAAV